MHSPRVPTDQLPSPGRGLDLRSSSSVVGGRGVGLWQSPLPWAVAVQGLEWSLFGAKQTLERRALGFRSSTKPVAKRRRDLHSFRPTVSRASSKLLGLADRAQMSTARLLLAGTLLSVYVVAQAYQVFTGGDDWPLSSYPMYSGTQGPHASKHVMLGVSSEGEFELARAHTSPLTSARLRHVIASIDQPRHREAIGVFVTRYHEKRKKHPEWPELVALRRYQESWRIRPGLEGIDRPRQRLNTAVLALSPQRLRALKDEANGTAPPSSPQPAGPDDIILNASDAQLFGGVRQLDDRYASGGLALRFGSGPHRKPAKRSDDAARFRFEAQAGEYYVWLRGKAIQGKRADSVWVQLKTPGRRVGQVHREGMGHFREGLPARAFAWSSTHPAKPPARLRLRSGPQELWLTPREGPVVIDQIVLSRVWRERPPQEGPATR